MLTETPMAPPKTKSQALCSYDVADFPDLTGREEQWRFTPLRRLGGLATAGPGTVGQAPRYAAADLPAGVSLHVLPRTDPRIGTILTPVDRISALAYGGTPEVRLLSVAPAALVERPAVIEVGAGDGLSFGHLVIDVGELAEVILVLHHRGPAQLADNVEVSVGAGAQLTLVTVADWATGAVQAQHLKARLQRDARLTHVQVSLGGDLVRQQVSVEYAGRGADAQLYGIYFAGGGQHLEHRLFIDHGVPDCRSYVAYRGALHGVDAHTVWVGDVLIRTEATGTDTYEVNRNLLLGDGGRADSVPNLEIETGEVIGAGHASATGRFDDEQLFYLMARGIPEAEARKLVVRGFFAELLAKIPVPDLRERLGVTIEARLDAADAADRAVDPADRVAGPVADRVDGSAQ